ncbi:MAG TPA: hypothetical protein VF989_12245, partial [Polyangiaceae bacterium]
MRPLDVFPLRALVSADEEQHEFGAASAEVAQSRPSLNSQSSASVVGLPTPGVLAGRFGTSQWPAARPAPPKRLLAG